MRCKNRITRFLLVLALMLLLAVPSSSLDLNSSESLQYYGNDNLGLEATTGGDVSFPGIADFSSTGITFQQPLSVGSGIELTDSTSNTIESYSTFYLTTSSGSSSDIVLSPSGDVGVEGNLSLTGELRNFFGSACPSGETMVDVNSDGTYDCVSLDNEVQDTYVNRAGDTMTGTLDMQSNSIIGISNLGGSGIVNSNNIASSAVTPTELDETGSYSLGWGNLAIAQSDISLADVGTADANLNMNGYSITNFFGTQCNSGNLVAHVNDDGTLDCLDVTSEVSGDFVNRAGDTMTGTLDMQSNTIINAGSGNIDIGDGAGDINMNGNRIYGSSLGHFQEGGVSDTLSNTQNNLDTLSANSFYVAGDVKVGGDFIGTGGDVAEIVNTEDDRNLEPGTVATISGDIEVEASTEAYDTAVAGIVSTDPGVKLAQHRDGVPLALTGIVPVKATVGNGDIEHGDLLTTSDKKGYAMKCGEASNCSGAIIGKAMGSLEENGKVETLVTLG